MKKNFVRTTLLTATVVGAVTIGGCGSKQEAGVEANSNVTHTNYELTEEEKELVYSLMYAEAMSSDSKLGSEMLCNLVLARSDARTYYIPTTEELQWAYLMAAAVAGDEEALIQTMVTNVDINRAKAEGISLVDVFTAPNHFSGVHNGVPSICTVDEDGKVLWTPVTEDMLTDELKEAVDAAFMKDYTDGAIYYIDKGHPLLNPNVTEPEEFIQEGDWIFFKRF